MSPPAIPKVAIPPEKWTQALYSTPESCLAQSEPAKLPAMQFDPSFWSKAYVQCIGRGNSHKACVDSLPDDTRITPPGPLGGEAASKELAATIACVREHGGTEKCTAHFEALSKLAGYEEPVIKSSSTKAMEFCNNAGYKMLGVPALFVAMKYIKIK
mmetsp:Transcript_102663/g.279019  ORF Transcript_102663/g.279019 Transcript_102663/m.279019 type:complete len:157 (+) Transcript_102663:120-590(+)